MFGKVSGSPGVTKSSPDESERMAKSSGGPKTRKILINVQGSLKKGVAHLSTGSRESKAVHKRNLPLGKLRCVIRTHPAIACMLQATAL
jgi:hypothetical protein